MAKRNSKTLNQQYARPLPLVLSSEKYNVVIPTVFPHNPISWIYLLWKIAEINVFRSVPQSLIPQVEVVLDGGVFKVSLEQDMNYLWCSGFFGKGVLSRSEPTWKDRTIQRLNLDDDVHGSNFAMEELTKKRREERKKFKTQRAIFQELELKQRRQPLDEAETIQFEELKVQLNAMRNANQVTVHEDDETIIRIEDQDLIDPETNSLKENLEYLQLQAIETFYLKFSINSIKVIQNNSQLSISQLFQWCCAERGGLNPDNKFILDYVVYHHYRSLAWCVRCGIKFGCDMLLYKRGPPFTHAEHAAIIIPNDEGTETNRDWFELASIARVIGTVKKNLVLVFVDYPSQSTFDEIIGLNLGEKEKFTQLFEHYKVSEILYKRWAPGRTRD